MASSIYYHRLFNDYLVPYWVYFRKRDKSIYRIYFQNGFILGWLDTDLLRNHFTVVSINYGGRGDTSSS